MMMIDRVVGKVEIIIIIDQEAEVVIVIIITIKGNITARRGVEEDEVGATVEVEVMMMTLLLAAVTAREVEAAAGVDLDIMIRRIEKNTAGGSSSAAAGGGGGGGATFGKYGIINTSDFNKAQVKTSFERWLAEVKGIASFNGPKHELMEFYKEYMEDYNTATLPHIKNYDFLKWEMEEYARKKKEAHDKAAAAGGGGQDHHAALDEFHHKEEMAKRAKQKKLEELRQVTAGLTAEKRDEMKHQARLRHEMAVAYKTGDEETRKRLQRRLEPEELAKR